MEISHIMCKGCVVGVKEGTVVYRVPGPGMYYVNGCASTLTEYIPGPTHSINNSTLLHNCKVNSLAKAYITAFCVT